jgi:hypothetical protein
MKICEAVPCGQRYKNVLFRVGLVGFSREVFLRGKAQNS